MTIQPTTIAPAELTVLPGDPAVRDPGAVDFLESSGLPLAQVVLGLFDQSDDCVKVLSADGRVQFMNCNGRAAMEVDDFCMVGNKEWWLLWPDDMQEVVKSSVDTAQTGALARFQGFCPTAKGAPRWWDVTVSPVRDVSGAVVAMLASSRDITERVTREEALVTIAHEMRHRLRNAYTLAGALASAAAREHPTHRDFARDLVQRLHALAETQGRLLDAPEVGSRLPNVVKATVGAFSDVAGRLDVGDLPDVPLDEATIRALALTLGELCTNSVKYGALGTQDGKVALSGSRDGDAVLLRWEEDAVTRTDGPAPASGSGSGMGLMERMLRLHGGALTHEWTPAGLVATVRLIVRGATA